MTKPDEQPVRPEGPPSWASKWLLHRLGSSDETQSILGDLHEDFVQLRGKKGARRARAWYWQEALLLSLTVRPSTRARPASRSAGPRWRRSSSMSTTETPPFAALTTDIRYAYRAVRKDLRLFFLSVLIIGLGVGACTAVYSVLSPLMLRQLPFEEPDRLVWVANDGEGGMSAVTSRAYNLRDFRTYSRSFDGLSGYDAFFDEQSYNLVGESEPVRLIGVRVVADFLEVLGVQPLLGRNFVAEEGLAGGPQAVILSHAFWLKHFAADPAVVGTAISLNNEPRVVVGVLPPSFDFASTFAAGKRIDFLRPFPISQETDGDGNTLSMIGRLTEGATVESAQADLERVMQGLREAEPNRRGLGAVVTDLQLQISGPYRSAMLLLAAAAAAMMLIVCVNLSNLLLAKGARRRREMAVRGALGASRSQLVRQMLIESLMLSVSGALCGLSMARIAIHFVTHAEGFGIPLLRSVSLDGGALLFSAALAILVGIVVGIVPAIEVTGGGKAAAFRGSSRSMSSGRRSRRWREGLVVAEVALASILLVLGGLLLQSFHNVLDVELGFRPQQVAAWQVTAGRDFADLTEAAAFFDQIVTHVQAIPGVLSVGLTDAVPLSRNRSWGLSAPGHSYDGRSYLATFPYMIDRHYFQTLEVPLVAGRNFTAQDTLETGIVVILNETAAKRVFNGEDPLGRKVVVGNTEVEVVGVVADTRHQSLEMGAGPQMYFPYTQVGAFDSLDLVVRSTLPTHMLAKSVADAIHAVAPNVPAGEYQTLEGLVERSLSPRRFTLQVLISFAATALLLAALGIYGVLSYSVTERLFEIGIRLALGDTAVGILRRVVGKTLMLATIGLTVGTVGAVAASRWVASLLYSVTPSDPWVLMSMASILMTVAGLAGLIPAVRASRTEAATVLRSS